MGLCLCIGACACLAGSAAISAYVTYSCIREDNDRCDGECSSQK